MSHRVWTPSLAVLSAAASLVVVVLAFRVHDLSDELRRVRFEMNLPQVGDVVPGLAFPVVLLDDQVEAAMYRIPGVPLTIVLDDVGRIVLVRPGAFSPAAVDSPVMFLRSQRPRAKGLTGG